MLIHSNFEGVLVLSMQLKQLNFEQQNHDLVVWGEVQICIWPSWSHCYSLSLAPGNSDWFWFYPSGTGSTITKFREKINLWLFDLSNTPHTWANAHLGAGIYLLTYFQLSMKWRVPDQEVYQRGLGKRLCKDCQARNLNREDATDRSRWRKLLKGWLMITIGVSGWKFVLVLAHLGSPGQRAIK